MIKVKLISAGNASKALSMGADGKPLLGIIAGTKKRVKFDKVGDVREMDPQEGYELLSKNPGMFQVEGGGGADAAATAAAAAESEKQKQAEESKVKEAQKTK